MSDSVVARSVAGLATRRRRDKQALRLAGDGTRRRRDWPASQLAGLERMRDLAPHAVGHQPVVDGQRQSIDSVVHGDCLRLSIDDTDTPVVSGVLDLRGGLVLRLGDPTCAGENEWELPYSEALLTTLAAQQLEFPGSIPGVAERRQEALLADLVN